MSNPSHTLAMLAIAAGPYLHALEGVKFRKSPSSTHIDGFHPDNPRPKKPGFRPKKLRKNRK